MFDATDQILRQLRAGEDSRTEFKELRYSERGVISPRTENLAAGTPRGISAIAMVTSPSAKSRPRCSPWTSYLTAALRWTG